MSLYRAELDLDKVRPRHPEYNGRNGNGYQPKHPDYRPPTTEYYGIPEGPENTKFKGNEPSWCLFGCLCIGIALGASIG